MLSANEGKKEDVYLSKIWHNNMSNRDRPSNPFI